MRDLTTFELGRVATLESYALLQVTATGLRKSILDATKPLRAFFAETNFHDYGQQPQGTPSKVVKAIVLVDGVGVAADSTVSLVRPSSGNGDPRLWISGLKNVCKPGDLIAFYYEAGTMHVANVSRNGQQTHETLDGSSHDYQASDHILNAILDRATGGRDVAARPNDANGLLPTVHRAPGVAESIRWILRETNGARFIFLVGGPGAGKSHAASAAVAGLTLVGDDRSDLADRSYDYAMGDRRLRLINDATISSSEFPESPLANELRRAVANNEILIVCVNRGVLIEELASLAPKLSVDDTVDRAILTWISSPVDYAKKLEEEDSHEGPVIVTGNDAGYLVNGSLRDGERKLADLVVVNLDSCSLLEVPPNVEFLDDGSRESMPVPARYRIVRSLDRHLLDNESTPAGALVSAALRGLEASGGHEPHRNPFTANIASLKSSNVQSGVLSVLRSAEVVTAANFTFRDMWGVIGRCLVGDASQQLGWVGVRETVDALWDDNANAFDRFTSLQKLASYRYSQALFGVGDDTKLDWRFASDPVTRRTSLVDPARDSIPGIFDPRDSASGWATPISDAFSGPVASGSPLETLVGTMDENASFVQAVQPFDWELDGAYVGVLEEARLNESQRAEIVAWYGRYLMRLYAVSQGISGYRKEVDDWTLAWTMSPSLPTPLDTCLRTLIRPARSSDSPPAIPALASRVEPIVGDDVTPRIARTSGTFQLITKRSGDSLLLQIVEAGSASPWIPLDFALVRHAASCTDGAIGLTEVADATSPRLERFRSTQLLNSGAVQSDYVVLSGSKTYKIQMGS